MKMQLPVNKHSFYHMSHLSHLVKHAVETGHLAVDTANFEVGKLQKPY